MFWICRVCGEIACEGLPARQLCLFCAEEYAQDLEDLEADMAADVE